jgi:hypothetical protein
MVHASPRSDGAHARGFNGLQRVELIWIVLLSRYGSGRAKSRHALESTQFGIGWCEAFKRKNEERPVTRNSNYGALQLIWS